jgi:hypothetical protein
MVLLGPRFSGFFFKMPFATASFRPDLRGACPFFQLNSHKTEWLEHSEPWTLEGKNPSHYVHFKVPAASYTAAVLNTVWSMQTGYGETNDYKGQKGMLSTNFHAHRFLC